MAMLNNQRVNVIFRSKKEPNQEKTFFHTNHRILHVPLLRIPKFFGKASSRQGGRGTGGWPLAHHEAGSCSQPPMLNELM